jgi:hypothetical protein
VSPREGKIKKNEEGLETGQLKSDKLIKGSENKRQVVKKRRSQKVSKEVRKDVKVKNVVIYYNLNQLFKK